MEVSFDVSAHDRQTIRQIANRAMAASRKHKLGLRKLETEMDVMAVHANGTPLDLNKFLDADEFNFAHDLMGIVNTLDRETGQLRNFFLPRCARPESADHQAA